jgi:protein SCO1/2
MRRSSHSEAPGGAPRGRAALAALAALVGLVAPFGPVGASADAAPATAAPDDEIPRPPPTYKAGGVEVASRLGARVPLDARFRALDGAVTTLGDVLRGELPTILTFNYSDCPQLCNLQLTGLTAALPAAAEPGPAPDGAAARQVVFRVGEQVRLVTISLDPGESLDRLRRMRDRYVDRLPPGLREAARASWVFLAAERPGVDVDIRRVAEAVGLRYAFIAERAEWAHPAALIFLSAAGAVTRYVHGIEFPPAMLRESIFKAGLAEPATAVGFLSRCYHFDPAASDNSGAAVIALRVGAGGFVALALAGLVALVLARRARRAAPSRVHSASHPRSLTEEGTRP